MLIATTANPGLITLNGIQTVNVRALAATTVDAVLYTGTTNFNSSGSQAAVTVNNALLATTFGLANTVPATLANLTIGYQAGQVGGTADVAKLALNGGVGSAIVASGAVAATVTSPVITVGTGIEGVTVTTTGTNYAKLVGSSAITTVGVSGSGTSSLDLAEIGTVLAVNASTSTGTNTFDFGAGFSTTDSVVGGTGADTVRGTLSGTVTGITLTNVETFRVNSGSNGVVAFSANPGITTLESRALTTGTETIGVTGMTSVSNIRFVGTGSTAAQAFSPLTLNSAFSGTADSVTVAVSNQTTASNTYGATVNSTGIETLTVTQADASAASTTTLVLGASSSTTKTGFTSLVFSSAGNVTIGGGAGSATNALDATTTPTAGGSLTSIDATGVAGAFSVRTVAASLANGATIKLGAGGTGTGTGNAVNVGAESSSQTVSITGGAWIDTITANAGIFTANLGAGADVFDGRQATSFSANGEAGNDTITSSLGTDVIVGGTGSDTAVFNLGAAAVAQVSTVTPAAATSSPAVEFSAGTLSVTIGGAVYSQVFATSIAVTNQSFVAANGAAILAATGVTVTSTASTGAALIFTGASTGASFTAPTAVITGTGTVAVATGTTAVLGVTSASNLTNLDLLTYVNADGDIIDLVSSAGVAVTMQVETATASTTQVGISAAGLVSFADLTTKPTTLADAVGLVNTAIVAGTETAGDAAVFVFNNQAYLFVTDGNTTLSTTDVLVALTGINTLTTGMTFSDGNIITIA